MCFERRSQFECFWLTREFIHAKQKPSFFSLLRNLEFVFGNVERRSFPSIRGLDLNQTFATITCKACNIVTGTVSVFFGNPSDPFGQIIATALKKGLALMVEYTFLTRETQCPVALVSARNIKATRNTLHLFQLVWWRRIPQRWCNPDKKGLWLR